MQPMTGTTTGSDLFTEVNTRLDKLTTTISQYIYIEIYSYMCMYVLYVYVFLVQSSDIIQVFHVAPCKN